ncbi:hypothetical protein KP509_39G020100 [Ceratopteris richardii]|uniref:Uncharacterized protein n=1 Tax=Ceratopteris richardii TaxID=49495 RepID=A0A8T2PZ71_CERRI|nr:hypothetical protein KP509_39G020100 [Ceratopteris richardii]
MLQISDCQKIGMQNFAIDLSFQWTFAPASSHQGISMTKQ